MVRNIIIIAVIILIIVGIAVTLAVVEFPEDEPVLQ